MNRRHIIRTALLAATTATVSSTMGSATAGAVMRSAQNRIKRGMTAVKRAKTYLRAEPRQSEKAPAGPYAKREVDGLLFLTNAYGYSWEIPLDSYIEWHIDGENTYLNFRCINHDTYRVKAFPCAVLGTMGGRFETSGKLESVPGMENEFRMKGEGMQSPIFDLKHAQKQTGFPCKLADLPQTNMYVNTSYSGNPTVNTFLDMYLHDVDTEETASHKSLLGDINAMNSNRTKAYNINVWFRLPDHSNGNTDRPDRAWAGGKVMGITKIANVDFHVILKIETGGANYFRYLALIPVNGPIHSLSINSVMDWAINGMRPMLERSAQAKEMMSKADPRGYAPPRWPDKQMVLSGLHIGNEIWWSDPNGQEGIVKWHTLKIDVEGYGSFGWGDRDSANLMHNQNPELNHNQNQYQKRNSQTAPAEEEQLAYKSGYTAPDSASEVSIDPADAKYADASIDPVDATISTNTTATAKPDGIVRSLLNKLFKQDKH